MSKNCTPLWRKAHSEVKMLKNWRSGTTFGSTDAEKLYAAVAKSTFASQNVQTTVGLGPLSEVQMSKNCTPLWRKAHLKVKMLKTCSPRSIFWRSTVEKLPGTPLWRKAHSEVKMLKNCRSGTTFGSSDAAKIVRRCGEKHIWQVKMLTNHCRFGPLSEVQMSKNCTPLWRNAHLKVKMLKNCSPLNTHGVPNESKKRNWSWKLLQSQLLLVLSLSCWRCCCCCCCCCYKSVNQLVT